MRNLRDYIVEGIFDIEGNIELGPIETVIDWIVSHVKTRYGDITSDSARKIIMAKNGKIYIKPVRQLIIMADSPIPVCLETDTVEFVGSFSVNNVTTEGTNAFITGDMDLKSILKCGFDILEVKERNILKISDFKNIYVGSITLREINKIKWDADLDANMVEIRHVDLVNVSKFKKAHFVYLGGVKKIINMDTYDDPEGQIIIRDSSGPNLEKDIKTIKAGKKIMDGIIIKI